MSFIGDILLFVGVCTVAYFGGRAIGATYVYRKIKREEKRGN